VKAGIFAGVLSCAAVLVCSCSASAQISGSDNPGRVEERFKAPPQPKSAPDIELPGPEAPLPPDKSQAIRFRLSGVVTEGATAFGQEQFAALYISLVGQEVTLAQMYALRDAITAKYRQAGYVLSQAIIPPQKISGGIVHIRIVEGYIDHVSFEGETGDARGLVREMAEKITASRPLNVKSLERYVLLISDIPGLSVRTVLNPDKGVPGAAELVFILHRKAFSGYAEADNQGSKAIGPEQCQIGVDFNSLLGLDEQTSLMFATTGQTKELQYGRYGSSWILGSEGTHLDLSASYSHTNPSGAIAVLDPRGHAFTASAFVDHPLIRSRAKNLSLSAGFTYLNSVTDLLGVPFSDDRLRYLSVRATFDAADTLLGDAYPASNLLNAEWDQGLNIFDESRTGSSRLSRVNGHSDYSLFVGTATRIQSFLGGTSLALSVSGQVASASLLTPVQFGLGGSRFGRGYEPSELTGDDGFAASVEGRYDLPFSSQIVGHPQFYAFYDIGQIWNIDPLPNTPSSASLASTGAGVRFTFLDRFDLDLEIANPLTRIVASRGDKNFRPLFNISTHF
jgi:hemolysin activation/secretion protein